MIQEIYKAPQADAGVQKALSYLHKQAVPVTYTSTAPTKDQVPFGGIVVHDDGTARRIYMQTGAGAVGYATLTLVTA